MEENKETEIKSNVERLELYSDNYPFNLSLRIKTFENEAEYNKFIKNCEKSIRGCQEYKLWRNYINDVLGIQTCAITEERSDECSVEIHHHVPSLFTLVKSIVNEKIEKEELFCTFDICTKAIELHFQNKVGFVVLITSLHEKVHNGALNIPKRLIRGDYSFFINNYSKYLDADELDILNAKLSITDHNCNWSKDDYPALKEGII